MSIEDYRRMTTPRSMWRRHARAAILRAINVEDPGVTPDALLKLVDAAYPFGIRALYPYKAWLRELEVFREAIAPSQVMPSVEEAAVCEVARGLVLDGRLDAARALLEQAPNRLARKCPACWAPSGDECFDISEMDDMLVPHRERLVGHRDAGPLFGGRP